MDQLADLPQGTPMSYEDAVKRLPVPAWDQSERFARYLSVDHSWYKIPVDREHPFFLFLDPTAGCTMEYRDGKPWRPAEVTPTSNRWPTTDQYRACFGFWNYHQTPLYHSPKYPAVWLSDGSRIPLSEDLAHVGLVFLDPFIHTNTPIGYIGGYDRFSKEKWPAESIFDRIGLCLQERLSRRPQRLKELLEAQIPAKFRTALKPSNISWHPARQDHDWPDDAWKQLLLDLRVPPQHWSPLCKYFELLNHEEHVGKLTRELPLSPDFPVGFVPMALAEERVLQLIRLTDAMASFLRRLAQPQRTS